MGIGNPNSHSNVVPTAYVCGDKRGFAELWVFSVSSYLRSVAKAQDKIALNMPIAAARLRALNRMVEQVG